MNTAGTVRDEQIKRINELSDFIDKQDTELTELMRALPGGGSRKSLPII